MEIGKRLLSIARALKAHLCAPAYTYTCMFYVRNEHFCIILFSDITYIDNLVLLKKLLV